MISLIKKKGINPITKQVLFYLKWVRRSTADTLAVAKSMSEGSSSYTIGEVAGVTIDLPTAILRMLREGNAVKINNLGTFKVKVTGRATDADPKKVTTEGARAEIIFVADEDFNTRLNSNIEYEVVTTKLSEEAQKDADDEDNTSGGGSSTPTKKDEDEEVM